MNQYPLRASICTIPMCLFKFLVFDSIGEFLVFLFLGFGKLLNLRGMRTRVLVIVLDYRFKDWIFEFV